MITISGFLLCFSCASLSPSAGASFESELSQAALERVREGSGQARLPAEGETNLRVKAPQIDQNDIFGDLLDISESSPGIEWEKRRLPDTFTWPSEKGEYETNYRDPLGNFWYTGPRSGSGKATVTTPFGIHYHGDVSDFGRVMNGRGTLHDLVNQHLYTGIIRDGKPHGESIVTYTDGVSYKGTFDHGWFSPESIYYPKDHVQNQSPQVDERGEPRQTETAENRHLNRLSWNRIPMNAPQQEPVVAQTVENGVTSGRKSKRLSRTAP